MNDTFILIYTIPLTNYMVKLYRLESNLNYIDQTTINSVTNQINSLELASEIVEIVQVLTGVVKTQIYDLSDNLLIDSGIILE